MNTGIYYITFFFKHPNDKNKADSTSRWWPEWHQYKRSKIDNIIEYGKIMLHRPNATPDPDKYILYADQLNLTKPNTILTGPFNFDTSFSTTRHTIPQFIHQSHWQKLMTKCTQLSIRLPTLSSSALSLHHWASCIDAPDILPTTHNSTSNINPLPHPD